ncbi:hypothetical protein FB451DRAFT_1280780, partial [Mycena latifolia]
MRLPSFLMLRALMPQICRVALISWLHTRSLCISLLPALLTRAAGLTACTCGAAPCLCSFLALSVHGTPRTRPVPPSYKNSISLSSAYLAGAPHHEGAQIWSFTPSQAQFLHPYNRLGPLA